MIKNIRYLITRETNPYKNLALEEYLLKNVKDDECILYLWQNQHTVVIGRNQNPWKECKVTKLEQNGGHLVRRLSGGGAVYHDLGNLNFTFLVSKESYDVNKQLDVILKAVNSLGIPAKKDGRNDITVEGKKFSGNAFYRTGKQCYHHGTLLVDVDMGSLSRYLNVSKKKLASKGVESVRSRVCNLKDYDKTLTIDRMIDELIKAFGQVYGLEPVSLEERHLKYEEIKRGIDKFSSWDWKYGKKMDFNYSIGKRFPWGEIDIKLHVSSGVIKDALIFSDALEVEPFIKMAQVLKDCEFTITAMLKAVESIEFFQEEKQKEDIIYMIQNEDL